MDFQEPNNVEEARNAYHALIKGIFRYREAYYVMNDPVVSDEDYDQVMHRIAELEERYPEIIVAHSPVQLKRLDNDADKVSCQIRPMLEVSKLEINRLGVEHDRFRAFSDYLRRTVEQTGCQVEFIAEPKLDGLAVELTYSNNHLVGAAPLKQHLDVTTNDEMFRGLLEIHGLPVELPRPSTGGMMLVVRGVITLPRRIYMRLEEEATSVRAAVLQGLVQHKAKELELAFIAYDVHLVPPDGAVTTPPTQVENYAWLRSQGFDEKSIHSIPISKPDHLLDIYQTLTLSIDSNRPWAMYPIEALIYKVNSRQLHLVFDKCEPKIPSYFAYWLA